MEQKSKLIRVKARSWRTKQEFRLWANVFHRRNNNRDPFLSLCSYNKRDSRGFKLIIGETVSRVDRNLGRLVNKKRLTHLPGWTRHVVYSDSVEHETGALITKSQSYPGGAGGFQGGDWSEANEPTGYGGRFIVEITDAPFSVRGDSGEPFEGLQQQSRLVYFGLRNGIRLVNVINIFAVNCCVLPR